MDKINKIKEIAKKTPEYSTIRIKTSIRDRLKKEVLSHLTHISDNDRIEHLLMLQAELK